MSIMPFNCTKHNLLVIGPGTNIMNKLIFKTVLIAILTAPTFLSTTCFVDRNPIRPVFSESNEAVNKDTRKDISGIEDKSNDNDEHSDERSPIDAASTRNNDASEFENDADVLMPNNKGTAEPDSNDERFCVSVEVEICDGRDNDCDGSTDEDTEGTLCSLANADAQCLEQNCTIIACTLGMTPFRQRT